jgi:putative membrane-bound dehydrogenase-like protein
MKTRTLALLSLAASFLAGSAVAQVAPEKAEATFTVHNPELDWKLWASEPLFANPTSMDIDHLGRIWVCESVNYRTQLRKKPLNRPAGDRILILEDSQGTGKADKVTVFYQSPELLAPLGIAVAKDPVGPGWKVYVCQSPDILVFEDKDGDGHADGSPKKLISGFRGIDHDHGVHGILIGPDGRLYFSVGDQGVENLQSSDGKGRKWTTNHTDCQAGTLWRCDLDGTNLELIAHNFRNPYEPCVDSFGNIWMSDNDDDGNQQTRICYVMPGGNYGYWPRGKGESHWHEEQPGVVPKVLRTYFGSPTGMCVYEGNLLPEKYRGMPLHVDAGPRHVRCYHTKPVGAGYEIDREDIVTSTDNWFRPSDICVAPDGSVFVADWYDPGVGGHGMGDTTRGRIYRLAPKGNKYAVPKVELDDLGALAALSSPCQAVRYMATAKIARADKKQLTEMLFAAAHSDNRIPQIRLAWQAAKRFCTLDPWLRDLITKGISPTANSAEQQAELRMLDAFVGIGPSGLKDDGRRALAQANTGTRREALLLVRKQPAERAKNFILELAGLYDGHDRFYLAAIGIAVGADPKRREIILADFDKQFPEWNDKVADLVWELRPPSVLPRLGKLLVDEKLTPTQRARIVDIIATSDDNAAGLTVLKLLSTDAPSEVIVRAIDNLRLLLPTKWVELGKSGEMKAVIDELLGNSETRAIGLQLVVAAKYTPAIERIAKMAFDGDRSAIRTLGQLPHPNIASHLEKVLRKANSQDRQDAAVTLEVINALGMHVTGQTNSPESKKALAILQGIVSTHTDPIATREAAVIALAGGQGGTLWLLDRHAHGELPADLVGLTGRLLRNSPFQGLRNRAMIAFPPPTKLDIAKLPALRILADRRGDRDRGRKIMAASLKGDSQCMKCHAVQGVGGNVGPDLATIGTKASRENLFESILYPSKAIADQWVQWNVTTTRGAVISGLIVDDKPDHLILRDANGKDTRIDRKDVSEKEKNPKSVMPDDIARTLTEDELIDLVEYLVTLRSGVK